MKQKLFILAFFLTFITVFWYVFGDEYKAFYETQMSEEQSYQQVAEEIQKFDLSAITPTQDSVLYVTPSTDVLESIIKRIDSSKKRVRLEVYIFTEKRMLQALKRAHDRGVEVRVILERNPYMAPNLNNKRFSELEDIGIDVVWSNTDHYALNHSKLLLIDETVFVSTGNMSYSTFTKNRDFIIETSDSSLVEVFWEIFLADYSGAKLSPYHESLVASPDYSRAKLQKMIHSSQSSLQMYFQYLQDDDLLEHIRTKARSWVTVEIILDDDFYERETSMIAELQQENIHIYKYPKSVMHAKAILVDGKYLFIGSVNFSSYSLDSNRELGLILSDEHIVEEFQTIFTQDSWGINLWHSQN